MIGKESRLCDAMIVTWFEMLDSGEGGGIGQIPGFSFFRCIRALFIFRPFANLDGFSFASHPVQSSARD